MRKLHKHAALPTNLEETQRWTKVITTVDVAAISEYVKSYTTFNDGTLAGA